MLLLAGSYYYASLCLARRDFSSAPAPAAVASRRQQAASALSRRRPPQEWRWLLLLLLLLLALVVVRWPRHRWRCRAERRCCCFRPALLPGHGLLLLVGGGDENKQFVPGWLRACRLSVSHGRPPRRAHCLTAREAKLRHAHNCCAPPSSPCSRLSRTSQRGRSCRAWR